MPCAHLALIDFHKCITSLFELEGKGRSLPKIDFEVLGTNEFKFCNLRRRSQWRRTEEFDSYINYDLVIDVSMLQRVNFSYTDSKLDRSAKNVIVIRSSQSLKGQRKIACAKPIEYDLSKPKQEKSLDYFLQNIFRKEEFLEGQLEILQRSLQMQSVIALLPTGAGKSLTYQLSTMLNQAYPHRRSAKIAHGDQVKGLNNAGIDSSIYINSSLMPRRNKIAPSI